MDDKVQCTRASLDPIFKNMNSVDKKHSLFFFYQFPSKCIDLTLVMKKGSEARDKILARQLIRTIRAERLVGVKRVPFSWMFRAPKRDPETGNIWVFNISGFTAILESFEPIFELRSITFSKITVKMRCFKIVFVKIILREAIIQESRCLTIPHLGLGPGNEKSRVS